MSESLVPTGRFPHVAYVNDHLYSKLLIEKTNTDGINGYGHLEEFIVSVWLALDVCKKCGLSVLTPYPYPDKYKKCAHRWEKAKLMKISVGADRTLYGAFRSAEEELAVFAANQGAPFFEQFEAPGRHYAAIKT